MKNFRRYQRKKTLKGYCAIETEDGETDLMELNMSKATIVDSMPVHVGNTILMYSKLHFLRFIEFLRVHLRRGSFKLVYADTGNFFILLTVFISKK